MFLISRVGPGWPAHPSDPYMTMMQCKTDTSVFGTGELSDRSTVYYGVILIFGQYFKNHLMN